MCKVGFRFLGLRFLPGAFFVAEKNIFVKCCLFCQRFLSLIYQTKNHSHEHDSIN